MVARAIDPLVLLRQLSRSLDQVCLTLGNIGIAIWGATLTWCRIFVLLQLDCTVIEGLLLQTRLLTAGAKIRITPHAMIFRFGLKLMELNL